MLDKWWLLVISQLGLLFNTRDMTISMTDKYQKEVLDLLDTILYKYREITVKQMKLLIGKLGQIGQAYRPVYYLMPQM